MKFQVRVVLDVTCLDQRGTDIADPEVGSEEHSKLARALADAVWDSLNGTSDEWRGRIYDTVRRIRIAIDGVDTAVPLVKGRPTTEEVLREFVEDINRAGGLVDDEDGSGLSAPAGSPDWVDLAVTYENACEALGLLPKREENDQEV
jgi:hypothetical protein